MWILFYNDISFSQSLTYNHERREGWCTDASKMERDIRFQQLVISSSLSLENESKGKDKSESQLEHIVKDASEV